MPTALAMALGITVVTKAPLEVILLVQHFIIVPIQCLSPGA